MTPAERAAAKALAYGLLYGRGAPALAAELEVSVPEAAAVARRFLASMPEAREQFEPGCTFFFRSTLNRNPFFFLINPQPWRAARRLPTWVGRTQRAYL